MAKHALHYYVARYYDPALSRFIQADPIIPDPSDPQTLNRYGYVRNDPLNRVDPTGHFSYSSFGGGGGGWGGGSSWWMSRCTASSTSWAAPRS